MATDENKWEGIPFRWWYWSKLYQVRIAWSSRWARQFWNVLANLLPLETETNVPEFEYESSSIFHGVTRSHYWSPFHFQIRWCRRLEDDIPQHTLIASQLLNATNTLWATSEHSICNQVAVISNLIDTSSLGIMTKNALRTWISCRTRFILSCDGRSVMTDLKSLKECSYTLPAREAGQELAGT